MEHRSSSCSVGAIRSGQHLHSTSFFTTISARLAAALVCALVLLPLTGCLKTFHLTLRPNADGSGTLDYTIVLKESTLAMMKEAQSEPDSTSSSPRSMNEQMRQIADSSNGVLRFESVKPIMRQGDTIGATATYHFSDITKLQMKSLFHTPDMGAADNDDSKPEMWSAFEFTRGTPSVLRVHSRKPEEFVGFNGVFSKKTELRGRSSATKRHNDEHMTNPFASMIADILDSMELSLEIVPKGTIVSTTASHRTNNTFVFAHADLSGLKTLTALRERNAAKADRLEKTMLKSFVVEKSPAVEIRFND